MDQWPSQSMGRDFHVETLAGLPVIARFDPLVLPVQDSHLRDLARGKRRAGVVAGAPVQCRSVRRKSSVRGWEFKESRPHDIRCGRKRVRGYGNQRVNTYSRPLIQSRRGMLQNQSSSLIRASQSTGHLINSSSVFIDACRWA